MKISIIISLILLGFLVGIPIIISGRVYYNFLIELSMFAKFVIVFITTMTGIIVEGYLKKKLK